MDTWIKSHDLSSVPGLGANFKWAPAGVDQESLAKQAPPPAHGPPLHPRPTLSAIHPPWQASLFKFMRKPKEGVDAPLVDFSSKSLRKYLSSIEHEDGGASNSSLFVGVDGKHFNIDSP